MPRVSVRLSDEEYRNLERLAKELGGATVSDVMRDMLCAHYTRLSVATAIAELRSDIVGAIKDQSGQKNGNGKNGDLAEVQRIVTIIARTMPAAAKQL